MKRLVVFATFFALLFSTGTLLWAQGSAESSVRGNLAGVVVDNSGAVVPGELTCGRKPRITASTRAPSRRSSA